jgi:hypothetical protein
MQSVGIPYHGMFHLKAAVLPCPVASLPASYHQYTAVDQSLCFMFLTHSCSSVQPVNHEMFIAHAGFEVLTVVVMKSTVFWDITPCSLLKVN